MATNYPDLKLFIGGEWVGGEGRVTQPVLESRHRRSARSTAACLQGGPRSGARGRAAQLSGMARQAAARARQDPATRGGVAARAHRDDRAHRDHGGGQGTFRDTLGSGSLRRNLRVVRGRRTPRVRARAAAESLGRTDDGDERAGGPSRRIRALEFPDRQSGTQDRRGIGRRLSVHSEARRRSARFGTRSRARTRRCGPACGCAVGRLRRSAPRSLRICSPRRSSARSRSRARFLWASS